MLTSGGSAPHGAARTAPLFMSWVAGDVTNFMGWLEHREAGPVQPVGHSGAGTATEQEEKAPNSPEQV